MKGTLCLIIVLLLIGTGVSALAESRNIYVGDIITLEIVSFRFSEEELREKFQAFEIIEMKQSTNGYSISLRTFETGEWTILLGDKEIVIHVASTLDDIERDGLFEGEGRILKSGIPFYWRLPFYISAGIFILSGGILLVKFLRKKKTIPEGAYQLFLRRSATLSADEDSYLVNLTLYFKEYIEGLHKMKIIGKTSAEISEELRNVREIAPVFSELNDWLVKCDILKFSGVDATIDRKRRHYKALLGLVERMENTACFKTC